MIGEEQFSNHSDCSDINSVLMNVVVTSECDRGQTFSAGKTFAGSEIAAHQIAQRLIIYEEMWDFLKLLIKKISA